MTLTLNVANMMRGARERSHVERLESDRHGQLKTATCLVRTLNFPALDRHMSGGHAARHEPGVHAW